MRRNQLIRISAGLGKFIYVLVIWGQSNASGADGQPSEVYLQNAIPGALIYDYDFQNFVTLDYPNNNQLYDGGSHGIELQYAYNFKQSFPNDTLLIVKNSKSGSNLPTNWAEGGVLRNELIEGILAAKQYVADQDAIGIYDLYGNQGEADSLHESASLAWYQNYLNFVSETEFATSLIFRNIIHCRLSDNLKASPYVFQANVQQAVEDLALPASPIFGRYKYFDPTALTLKTDEIHLTSASQNVLAGWVYDYIN